VFRHCVGTEEKLDQFSIELNRLLDVKSPIVSIICDLGKS